MTLRPPSPTALLRLATPGFQRPHTLQSITQYLATVSIYPVLFGRLLPVPLPPSLSQSASLADDSDVSEKPEFTANTLDDIVAYSKN
mmetsp:Transcript_20596/g.48396  ORF Transcript_20596/g.48396 Transcript_20596/m.48396 type:complete len:87 (-) Transcript_20596:88-348(-)